MGGIKAKKGASDDDPQKKCDTGVCARTNSDAVRKMFSFIISVRLARREQETSEQRGGVGRCWFWET